MTGCIPFKHGLKRLAGAVAQVYGAFARPATTPQVTVLMYHRVACRSRFDWTVDDWNVTPARFEQQMAWLAGNAECLALGKVQSRLAQPPGPKPLVAVTFDDGYGNFASRALPVLERYRIPAAVFLVTTHVDTTDPYPFDRWAQRNRGRIPPESWLPLGWRQVERCVHSGLVTFGSHSHSHPDGSRLTANGLAQEASVSREVLIRRLGPDHAHAYAYPYGSTRLGYVSPAYVQAVRQAGFRLGLTTDLGLVRSAADPLVWPRVEVHAWDTSAVVAAKAKGVLWPYRLTDRFRGVGRGKASAVRSADKVSDKSGAAATG